MKASNVAVNESATNATNATNEVSVDATSTPITNPGTIMSDVIVSTSSPLDLASAILAVKEAVNATSVFSLDSVAGVYASMTSTVLTDYLAVFYAATEAAVATNQLSPVLKLITDKGFARHWTEHNSVISSLDTDAAKLSLIRSVLAYWNLGVLTKSAYTALTRPAPAPKEPRAKAASSAGKGGSYAAIADIILTLSTSPDVDLSDRPAYAKIATALTSPNAKVMYATLIKLPKAAVIIAAAEAELAVMREAERAVEAAAAEAEANAMAAELADMFN